MRERLSSSPDQQRRRGQTTAEFALVATLFLLMLFGSMLMGLTVYRYYTVCSAAREAVRYAIVHSPASQYPATISQIQQIAINYAAALDPKLLTVNVTWPADPSLPSRSDAQVQVSYTFKLAIPFLSPINLTLSSTSKMLASQ
jgi:Flp pilus assembly protein TadG